MLGGLTLLRGFPPILSLLEPFISVGQVVNIFDDGIDEALEILGITSRDFYFFRVGGLVAERMKLLAPFIQPVIN